MFNKRRIKSLDFLEVLLILIFILLLNWIFYFVSNYLRINILVYSVITISLIVLTILVAAIAIFQFVKMKYLEAVKVEVKMEIDSYKTKIDTKVSDANIRIGHFEVDYAKKLKKISRDYLIKAKEIENIKKELSEKMTEIDRKTSELEIQNCLIKIEKSDEEHKIILYERIVKLNDFYPGVCDDEILKEINGYLKEQSQTRK